MKIFSALTICGITTYFNAKTVHNYVYAQFWNKTSEGQRAHLYTLKNQNITMEVSDYGGIITKLLVPDKNDKVQDITLGCQFLEEYETLAPYFGCITGRFANRIAGGTFTLNGEEFKLATNNGPNHLHGGPKGKGFSHKLYDTEILTSKNREPGVQFSYTSKDGEEGYPGELDLKVTYWLLNENALRIDYTATVKDKPTILNLTNHAYFNLEGEDVEKTVASHHLKILSDHILENDSTSIPTGALLPVKNTPFDFRKFKQIGQEIDSTHQQIEYGKGYDHHYVLKNDNSKNMVHAATIYEENSGRTMQVYTTEPGMQLYTANFLNDEVPNKRGGRYFKNAGFCLETSHFPDSPNKPTFPSVVLNPGDVFSSTTVY